MLTKVYVVEDNPIVRRVVSTYLNIVPDLCLCGAASTAYEALAQLPTVGADVVLVDIGLPDLNGIELVRELHKRSQPMPCIMLSSLEGWNYVQHALSVGAQGYIVKGNPKEIPEAIRQVRAGTIYLSPQLRYAAIDYNKLSVTLFDPFPDS